jgi:hypothetical protein
LATMYDILHLDTLEKQQRIFFTQKGE